MVCLLGMSMQHRQCKNYYEPEKDLEFIVTNKVTHIINCAGSQVQNQWLQVGVQYLTFHWIESDTQILFDDKEENLNKIFTFLENASSAGESCLVHSVRGQSRSCCVLAAYFMKKYQWTLYKTLEYLNSRRPDLEIRASFFYQLNALEAKLSKSMPNRTASWNELTEQNPDSQQAKDELIIRNTFLNSHNGPVDEVYTNLQTKMVLQLQIKLIFQNILNKQGHQKLRWKDQNTSNKENLDLATIVFSGSPDYFPPTNNNVAIKAARTILKGSNTTPKIISKQAQSKPMVQQQQLNQQQYQQQEQQQQKQQHPNQQQQSLSTQANSQLKSMSSKSLADQQADQQLKAQEMSNNPSFNNLLLNCALKVQQQQQTRPLGNKPIQNPKLNNNFMKPPLQQPQIQIQNPPQKTTDETTLSQLQKNMLRSTSLQQFEEKKVPEATRTNSVKHQDEVQDTANQILSSFQDFKTQVQMSLNSFNKDNRDTSNMRLSLKINEDLNKKLPHKSQLDQLISPSFLQNNKQKENNKSSSYTQKPIDTSKTLSQSILQLQSSYQKFQQLQQENKAIQNDPKSLKQSISTSQINHSKTINDITKNSLDLNSLQKNIEAHQSQLRSNSVPKKPNDDLLGVYSNKRPNSAEAQKQADLSQSKKDKEKKENIQLSPSQLKKKPQSSSINGGPPLPQSTSQLYLRNVQCRRQAASTLRNQRPINSQQDRYMNHNQSANNPQNNNSASYQNISGHQNTSYVNNNSYFNDNSICARLNIDKQADIYNQNRSNLLKTFNNNIDSSSRQDLNSFKRVISPNGSNNPTQLISNSKSQLQFQKNQPIRAVQDVNDNRVALQIKQYPNLAYQLENLLKQASLTFLRFLKLQKHHSNSQGISLQSQKV